MTGYHMALILGIGVGIIIEHLVVRLTGHSIMNVIVRIGSKRNKK